MIIDAHHAVASCSGSVSIPEHRSVTLPYLSLRLLHASRNENLVSLPHSPTDDLESFVWILLHVILMRAPSGVGTDWLEQFAVKEKKQHHMARVYIKTMIISYQNPLAPSLDTKFDPFIPILNALLIHNRLEEEEVTLCKEYYQQFLEILFAAASDPSTVPIRP
ncbi:hypothetical protein SISNIDRAFT_482196 [Sistotremastrum niveocremeum HHB9708]|uniref:Uncharacterized protein n=1 Tax=Sistotremastrum niveocremeum HHB9708 TaxID=1314777 RepID=A0A164YV41_9AGAM|nr:hypothetical protein SISNIDRAFT_482196 [Sistotremastrum niveocremeum HHB9708]